MRNSDRRGVSDVVAFVLVFSLVVTTTGVVYAVGFTGLEQARDAERIDNAERAFEVLGDNMADIYLDGAPSRKTEIKLADATLSFGEPTRMNVSIEGDTINGNQLYYEATPSPIVFSLAGTDIAYEGGAVIRSADGYAWMVREPPLRLAESRTVLTYVVTSPTERTSVSGDATVLVRGVKSGQTILVSKETAPVNVTFTIETTTPRATVWKEYINEQADWTGADWSDTDADTDPCGTPNDLGGGRSKVTCTIQTQSFYLVSTGISVSIEA